MAGIEDLGNGDGYIYVVDPDKSTIIKPILNNPEGARDVKLDGVRAQSVALNRVASGTIQFDAPTGGGSITSIVISGIEQIDIGSPIAYVFGMSGQELATAVSVAINNHFAGSGLNYSSNSDGDVVNVIAPSEQGGNINGDSISVTATGNLTWTESNIEGGSNATEIYDQSIGYTFFLNADYDSSGCGGKLDASPDSLINAIEITNYIVPRSLTSAIDSQDVVISNGVVNFERKSVDTLICIDTESSAATDDLLTINTSGFAEGDKITFRGINSGRVTTFDSGAGNIELEGGVDFMTGGFERAITLQLKDNIWYEVSRTSQAIGGTSDYRDAGFGFFGIDEFNTQVISTNGTITYNGGSNDKYQEITGSDTLTGNSNYDLGTGINGDEFWLEYNASTILDGNNLIIFGITLSEEQALNGGYIFRAKYMEGDWRTYMTANENKGIAFPQYYTGEDFKDESIPVSKLESSLQKDFFTVPVSWETDELGIIKVPVPYNLTVTKISTAVAKTIGATDDATLVPKDNGGNVMNGGTTDIPPTTPLDNIYEKAITGNNVFLENQYIWLETLKSVPGGKGLVTIWYTRD